MEEQVTWGQRHKKSILLAFLALAVGGMIAAFSVPVSLFPKTTFPRVVVTLDSGSRPVDRMEVEVTVPVEEAVRAVVGVTRVRSNTSRGSSEVSVDFAWGTEMIAATLQVESAIHQARSSLPEETSFEVRRMDPTVFPVLGYALTSSEHSSAQLREMALFRLRPVIQAVPGVARVAVLGGDTNEYQVIVDRDRLLSQGVSLDEVQLAVASANDASGIGYTEDVGHLYLVLGHSVFKSENEIADVILKSAGGAVVRLGDVAEVKRAPAPQWIRVRVDGKSGVIFQVYQQPDGDSTRIAGAISERLGRLKSQLPDTVSVSTWYDQTELINASASSVRNSLGVGIILTFFVLMLFLKDWRVSLVAVLSVPPTLAITAMTLHLAGQSFNIMTLGAMAAAVGLIIDDALVMIEHLVRRLRSFEGSLEAGIARGSREFTTPLVGSSAVTIIIFTPMAFVDGVSGAFFKPLALTIAVCLTVSFFVSLFAVPSLTQMFLAGSKHKQSPPSRLATLYSHSLGGLLKRPWWALVILLPIVVLGAVGYLRTGSGFMPAVDEGGFVLDYVVEPGTSLSETDRRIRQIEEVLDTTPEVRAYSRRTGISLSGGLREANEGDFFVRLVPAPRLPLDEVMGRIRTRLEEHVPGVEIEMALLMEDLIGDLTATPQPIEVKIFGDDYSALMEAAPLIAQAIEKVRGVVDVKSGVVLAGDAWEIDVDRQAAALEGTNPADISRQLKAIVSGVVASQIHEGPQMVNVRVWTPGAKHLGSEALMNMRLRAADGHFFALHRVAKLRSSEAQAQIAREDLKRMVAISGRIAGRDMGSVMKEIKQVLAQPDLLPEGSYFRLGGLYQEQQTAMRSLFIAFAAALMLIFIVLLYLTERFRVALCTMIPALGAAAAAFCGLWLTGTELNITALMGLIMVVGIVTEVSVFFVFEAQSSSSGDPTERLVRAGSERATPMIMTSLVASFALLPIALGVDEGAAMLRPMAITIISGLIVKLPLALFVLPASLRWVGWK